MSLRTTRRSRRYAAPAQTLRAIHPQFSQDRDKKVSKLEQSGLTEEELLAKQEELFAASRAKFQNAQQ
jgi:down-regulator of transcription 1